MGRLGNDVIGRMTERGIADLSQPLGRIKSLLEEMEGGERSDSFRWVMSELIKSGLRPEGGHTPETMAETLGLVATCPALGRFFLDLGGFHG